MRPPIVSRKHYVQFTEYNVASATVTTHNVVVGKNVQDTDQNFEVTQGSLVKAVFIEMWLLSDTTVVGSFVVMVERASGGQNVPTFTNMTTLDAYPNKKNVLFVSQGLLGENDANPTPVLRQWIKIPKGKQRIGLDDSIRVNIAAIGSAQISGCEFEVYKSYS